jgi:hydroxyacylglutathione hydrolase
MRMERGVAAIDVRDAAAFGNAHIAGSINLGLTGNFAPWAGALIAIDRPVVIIADDTEQARQAVLRLARVGMESVEGYLDGGIATWNAAKLPLRSVAQMPVDELHTRMGEGTKLQLLDVRKPGEYQGGHLPGAINVPLDRLEKDLPAAIDAKRATAVVCASGYRSSAATSLLERHGFNELYNVTGGTTAWVNAGYGVEK